MQTKRFLRVAGRPSQLLRPWWLARSIADALAELARLADALGPAVDDSAWDELAAALRRASIELRVFDSATRTRQRDELP